MLIQLLATQRMICNGHGVDRSAREVLRFLPCKLLKFAYILVAAVDHQLLSITRERRGAFPKEKLRREGNTVLIDGLQ